MQDREVAGYKCPLCSYRDEEENNVRLHIKESEEGEHKKLDGFTSEYQPVKLFVSTEIPETERLIYGASQELRKLDNDVINQIADAANTSTTHVIRVLEDNGVEYTWKGRTGATSWDDLTELQRKVLHTYINDQRYTPRALAGALDTSKKNTQNIMDRYSWLTAPKYFFEGGTGAEVNVRDVRREDALEFIKEHNIGSQELGEVPDTDEPGGEEKVDIQTELEEEDTATNAFLIASVEQQFKIITALSKDGEDELAEHYFRQAVGKEE